MNSSSVKTLGGKSGVQKWSTKSPVQENSTIARYSRVAMVEAVLSIRDRQQRVVRRMVVAGLALMGVTVIYGALAGWF